jgi:hypothetical protein
MDGEDDEWQSEDVTDVKFVCSLFNDDLSSSDCIASMNDELERMWREVFVALAT